MKLKKLTTVILSAALAVSALGAISASAIENMSYGVDFNRRRTGIDLISGCGYCWNGKINYGYLKTKSNGYNFASGSATYKATQYFAESANAYGQGLFEFEGYQKNIYGIARARL